MYIYIDLAVFIIGVLIYALSGNPKVQELGRIATFCGLLAFLLSVVGSKII